MNFMPRAEAQSRDERWMRHALQLASQAWGNTHPNPMVGSVLVDADDTIISEGYHQKAGALHAERMALTDLQLSRSQQQNSTLYVTLEPCCTQGRTPPCTQIILEKGIRKVVVGTIDPNPKHQSKGIDLLREHGVLVTTGVLEHECRQLNPLFNHQMTAAAPMITVKTATTLDGKIATASGNSRWITGPEARNNVMHWRKYFPAIAIGAGTALADDPSLTIRAGETTTGCPQRMIFDRSLRTLPQVSTLKVFNDEWRQQTWLITADSIDVQKLGPYLDRGVKLIQLPFEPGNPFPIVPFRKRCNQEQIFGIYVEGGQSLISSLLQVKAVDYLFSYRSPKLFASAAAPSFANGLQVDFPGQAPFIGNPQHEIYGHDVLTHGPLVYPHPS